MVDQNILRRQKGLLLACLVDRCERDIVRLAWGVWANKLQVFRVLCSAVNPVLAFVVVVG